MYALVVAKRHRVLFLELIDFYNQYKIRLFYYYSLFCISNCNVAVANGYKIILILICVGISEVYLCVRFITLQILIRIIIMQYAG